MTKHKHIDLTLPDMSVEKKDFSTYGRKDLEGFAQEAYEKIQLLTQQLRAIEKEVFKLRIEKTKITSGESIILHAARENKNYTFKEYTEERVKAQGEIRNIKEQLIIGALGLSGEVGEFIEHIKKTYFHGKELNLQKCVLELGDILWYINFSANALGTSLERVAQANNEKLRLRYPNGFSIEEAKKIISDNNKI